MAVTEVLLKEPVEGLGGEGDLVKVKAGYARNFLLPKNKAIESRGFNRKMIEALKARREQREARELEYAEQTKAKLETMRVAIPVKTGRQGDRIQIFGSVNAHHLMERLKEEGVELSSKQFHFTQTVKSLGEHSVKIRLTSEISLDFTFEVVSENPIEGNLQS